MLCVFAQQSDIYVCDFVAVLQIAKASSIPCMWTRAHLLREMSSGPLMGFETASTKAFIRSGWLTLTCHKKPNLHLCMGVNSSRVSMSGNL